ncbi:MAG: outer membrane lipoprotein-sorting protein [Archangium sp.]|nr:outer membrane lipoprotein-sorting protein [Archangium sp.]MDP3154025.1 outer membrane lipoprotein-sorting protein [Archangium sp.]MDP3570072.1 outer membrane lipoprotein-sorting protein [Archangium sp.]
MRVTLMIVSLVASAAFAEETAAEISKKSRERGALNLVGLTAEMKLVSIAADGKSKEQVLTSTSKTINGKSHALARFSAPAGVSGVAVLTIAGEQGQGDDVSLYLPKLKRVRKVAKSDRGKAFMDTDFSYADIGSNGTRDEDTKRLEDSKIEGRDCFVLEGKGDDSSPYGQVKMFVDKQTWVPMQVEYSDKSGKPLKRYRTLKLKQFKERVLAAESVMENLQSGTKTQMTVLKLEDSTLGDEAFTDRALERG